MTTTTSVRLAALVSVAILLVPDQAHAYIDPGAGSMLIQGVIGAIAALILVVKLYWRRLAGWFGRTPGAAAPPAETAKREP